LKFEIEELKLAEQEALGVEAKRAAQSFAIQGPG
jgi:hypothetical protein